MDSIDHFNFMERLRIDNEIPIFKINCNDNWFYWTKHGIHANWIDLDWFGLSAIVDGSFYSLLWTKPKTTSAIDFEFGIGKHCSLFSFLHTLH